MAKFTSFIKKTIIELDDSSQDREVNEKLLNNFIENENAAAMLMEKMAKVVDPKQMVELDMQLATIVENMEDTIMQLNDEFEAMYAETGEENINQAELHDYFMQLVEDIAERYTQLNLKGKGYFYSWVKHFYSFQDDEIETVFQTLDAALMDLQERKIKKHTFKYRGANDDKDLVMDLVTFGDFDLAYDVVRIDGSHKAFYELIKDKQKIREQNGVSKNLELAIEDVKASMVNFAQELNQAQMMDGDEEDAASKKNVDLSLAFISKWVEQLRKEFVKFDK